MGLVARHLEANGIPTVIVGSALDIILHCGVPRFLFNDLPLGNPIGRPWDVGMQRDTVARALALLETARAPRTTVTTTHRFGPAPEAWRENFLRIDAAQREILRRAGERRREKQRRAKASGLARED